MPLLPPSFASSLLALLCGGIVTYLFRHVAPASDGAAYFECAARAWSTPVTTTNFICGVHNGLYTTLSVLHLSYRLGFDPLLGVKIIQFVVFAVACIAFARLYATFVPHAGVVERNLATTAFALTPSYVVYVVGVSADNFVVTFSLLYMTCVFARRPALAAAAGTALVFCKEAGLLFYAVQFPLALFWFCRKGAVSSCLLLCLPLAAYGLHYYMGGRPPCDNFCGDSIVQLAFASNLLRREIQSYLFDLFIHNFQWLLLIPPAIATWKGKAPVHVDRRRLLLLLGFLVCWLYTITRCPIWNNVKYITPVVPLWLLVSASTLASFGNAIRIGFFCTLLGAHVFSNFINNDPVSRKFFGTDPNSGGALLCMNSWSRPPEERGCGNDESIYSLLRWRPSWPGE